MSFVPESYRNMPVENNWSGYTGTAQTTTQSAETKTSNDDDRRRPQRPREDNINRKAALDVLQWHRWTSTPLKIEWHPTKEFDARDVKQKMDFWNEARKKTTLEDILNIALDVCDDERGTYGRLHFSL